MKRPAIDSDMELFRDSGASSVEGPRRSRGF